MAKHRAFMKMYWPEFIADTMHLKPAEIGVYILLIAHYWQHGGLPNDDNALATIARVEPRRFAKMRSTVNAFFSPDWRHKRIDLELKLVEELHDKRSIAGVVGNSRRWQMRSQNDRRATHNKKDI